MSSTEAGTLSVPGAKIYYRLQGSGPVLLLIPAGAGDADSFDGVATLLADNYSILSYDRRGYSRSTREDPTEPIRVETHSQDAARLLAAVSTEAVYVFGGSGGAIVGLDLAIRHPERVRACIAHEPPTRQLLPDGDQLHDDMYKVYGREGVAAAIRAFAASIGVNRDGLGGEQNAGVGELAGSPWAKANAEFFLAHDVPAVGSYHLDLAALKAAPTRIVPAAGIDSRGYWPYRCAEAVAEQLRTALVEFPGNHAGFVTSPTAFAQKLRVVLGE